MGNIESKVKNLGSLGDKLGYLCMVQYNDGTYSDGYVFRGIENGKLVVNTLNHQSCRVTYLLTDDSIRYIDLPDSYKLLVSDISLNGVSKHKCSNRFFGFKVCNWLTDAVCGIFNTLMDTENKKYNKIAKGIRNTLKFINIDSDRDLYLELIGNKDSLKVYCRNIIGYTDDSGNRVQTSFYTTDSRIKGEFIDSDGTRISLISCNDKSIYTSIFLALDEIGNYIDRIKIPWVGEVPNLSIISREGNAFVFNSRYRDDLLRYFDMYGECYTFGSNSGFRKNVDVDRLRKSAKGNPYIDNLLNEKGDSLSSELYGVYYKYPNLKATVYRHSDEFAMKSKLVVMRVVKQKGLDGSTMYYYIENIQEPSFSKEGYPDVVYASTDYNSIKEIFQSMCKYKHISVSRSVGLGEPFGIGGNKFYIKYIEDGTDRFRVIYTWANTNFYYESVLSKYGNAYDCHYKRPDDLKNDEVDIVRETIKSRFPCLNKSINGRYTVYKYINNEVAYDRQHEYMNASLFSQVLKSISWIKGFRGIIVLNDGNKILKEYYYDGSLTGVAKYRLIARKG